MVTYHPMDGDPPTQGWYPTRRKYTPDSEFGTLTKLTKLIPGDNCPDGHLKFLGWSPTPHEWLPTGRKYTTDSEFGTETLFTKLRPSVNYTMDGRLPSYGWSPTNPRMVTHQMEVYYRLGIWH